MKTIISALVLLAALSGAGVARAQQGITTMRLAYSVATPAGGFKDFVAHSSWRGFTGEVLYGINDKFSVGLATGFQDFYQKYPRQMYKLSDGSDISAVVSNSVQVVPVMAKGLYHFPGARAVQSYVGLGLGANMISYSQYAGAFADTRNQFGFAAEPEAGIKIPFSKNGPAGFSLSAACRYMPFRYNDLDNLNSYAISAGVIFPLR